MSEIKVSCSKLARFLACPSSSLDDGSPLYNPENPDAKLGTAGHAAAAQLVKGLKPNLRELAQIHGVELEDLSIAFSMARKAWEQLRQHFPNAEAEQSLEGDRVKGRCDVISWGEAGAILDWDFGWAGTEKLPQLKGYAVAAVLQRGWPSGGGEILGVHVHARQGTFTSYSFGESELREFNLQIAGKLKRVSKDYGPSHDACRFCPRQLGCQAYAEFSSSAVSALVGSAQREVVITDALLSSLYGRWQQARKACEAYEKLLGERLKTGDLQLDGKLLRLVDQEIEKIDPILAWPTLIRELSQDELGSVLSVGKTALVEAIKSKAPRGEKGARADQMMDELRELGAISTEIRKIRREVKP